MNKLTHRIYSKTEFLGPPMGEIRESINHRFSISLDARYWGNNRGTREGMQFMGDYEDINFFLNSGSFGDLKIEPILTSAPQVSVPHPNLSSVRVVCNNCSGVFDHLSDGTISECPHCKSMVVTTAPAVCCKFDGSIVSCTCGVDYFASSNPVCPNCSKSNPFHVNSAPQFGRALRHNHGDEPLVLDHAGNSVKCEKTDITEYDEQLLRKGMNRLLINSVYGKSSSKYLDVDTMAHEVKSCLNLGDEHDFLVYAMCQRNDYIQYAIEEIKAALKIGI